MTSVTDRKVSANCLWAILVKVPTCLLISFRLYPCPNFYSWLKGLPDHSWHYLVCFDFSFKSYFCFCSKKNNRICTNGLSRTRWMMALMWGRAYSFWLVIKLLFHGRMFPEILIHIQRQFKIHSVSLQMFFKNWRGYLTAWLSGHLLLLCSFVVTAIKNHSNYWNAKNWTGNKCLNGGKETLCFPLAASQFI